jgi:predicted TIM-barrel fold metal-dependent hydrolase
MLIDTHVHLGRWPFTFAPDYTAAQLAAHLRARGIHRALVSPLDAVLAPDPLPANRALFAAVRQFPALLPVPTVNPALAHWREQLDFAATGPLRTIKLYPNYHNYRLDASRFDAFFAEVEKRKLKLIISVRIEDDRHRYFALRMKDVPVKQLAAFLKKYPKLHPLLTGPGLPNVRELAKLKCENFSADTSFMEWLDSLPALVREFPARRILFGSHAPFFITQASLAKLTTAKLSAANRAAISSGNAERFFGL